MLPGFLVDHFSDKGMRRLPTSLSFPLKRNAAALQEPPSVFEKSPEVRRPQKRPLVKSDERTPKRARMDSTVSKTVKSGDLSDKISENPVNYEESPSKDSRSYRSHKRSKEKHRKRSNKKRIDEDDRKNKRQHDRTSPEGYAAPTTNLVASYSSDEENEATKPLAQIRPAPATLPRTKSVSSPKVKSERKMLFTSTSPQDSTTTKVTKETAKSTWDSSDSDFETALGAPIKSSQENGKDDGVVKKKERLYLPVQHEVEGVLLALTHPEEDLPQLLVLVLRVVVVYLDRIEDEVVIKRADITAVDTAVGQLLDLFTRTVLIQGLQVVIGGEGVILEVGVILIAEDLIVRIPLEVGVDVIPHLIDHIPVIARVLLLPLFAEEQSPIVGFLSTFTKAHKPSQVVAAAASEAVKKVTGRIDPSPSVSPLSLSKLEETSSSSKEAAVSPPKTEEKKEEAGNVESEAKKDVANYIGPQVPPDMAKKLGLSLDATSTSGGNNTSWKAHVGAKKKSDKLLIENVKKSEDNKADFMIPPEKDEEYRALQAKAQAHAQQRQLQAATQQQQLAAISNVTPFTAAAAAAAMLHNGQSAVALPHITIEQLRARQNVCLLSGHQEQAIQLESYIRQQQQAENVSAALQQQQQQQQLLQMMALHQQQQQNAALLMAAQQANPIHTAQQAALLLAAQQNQHQATITDHSALLAAQVQQQAQAHQALIQRQILNATALQQQQILQMRLYASSTAATAGNQAVIQALPANTSTTAGQQQAFVNGGVGANTTTSTTANETTTSNDAVNTNPLMAAVAAAQRNQAINQEHAQQQLNAAAMVGAAAAAAAAVRMLILFDIINYFSLGKSAYSLTRGDTLLVE
ncbi:unnamed protein product [Rodentolepis nana]|uniref:Transcriptional regulator ATRX homolog n=1 Tax=Rodentolepis nana TaxID=102285 RepID=A0A0R3TPW3_RODNA|nr:unnamed protein product [Rodentolepis nana]